MNVFNGTTLLGAGTVNSSGIATLTTSSLTAGSDSITAVYSGNASTATSTSAVFSSLTVAAAPTFTIVAPQTPFTVAPGGFVNISITVPPLGGTYSNVVIMSASRLAGATSTFAPPSVTPGSAGGTTILTIQLAAIGLNIPPVQQRSFPLAPLGLALTVCAMFFGFRRSKTLQLGFAILALAAVTTIFVGCGVGLASEPSTPAGTYANVTYYRHQRCPARLHDDHALSCSNRPVTGGFLSRAARSPQGNVSSLALPLRRYPFRCVGFPTIESPRVPPGKGRPRRLPMKRKPSLLPESSSLCCS